MQTRGKVTIGLISLLALPLAAAGILFEQPWQPLGSSFSKYITNASTNLDGGFETAIVGYTIPGNLAEVRKVLREETAREYTWQTTSHAVHNKTGQHLWIREFEGFKAPGLNPAGPIHVDFSQRRKADLLAPIRRALRP